MLHPCLFFSLVSLVLVSFCPLPGTLLFLLLIPMATNNNLILGDFFLDTMGSPLFMMCMVVGMLSQQIQPKLAFSIALLNVGLGGFFLSSSLIHLYFWFESVLIVLLALILLKGTQPERSQAVSFLVIYTVVLSLPFLVVIAFLGEGYFSVPWLGLGAASLGISFLPMLVKLPMWGLHKWLAKAHVEAPLVGSMILAASLLKMGGYGLWRIMFFMEEVPSWVYALSSWAMIGAIAASIMAITQMDIKAYVAYTSVAHMGLVIAAMTEMSKTGIYAALLIMIGHGFTSSGLFSAANILYSQVQTRSLLFMRGSMGKALGLLWALILMSSFGFPFSINFFGEFLSVMVLCNLGLFMAVSLGLFLFLSAFYHFVLYTKMWHGQGTWQMPFSTSSSGFLNLTLHSILPIWAIILMLSSETKAESESSLKLSLQNWRSKAPSA